jgi:hypothetical protein
MKSTATVLIALCLSTFGCVQTLAIRTVGGIIDEYGFATLNEESDLTLAEQSLASNLKLLEIFLRGDPDNDNIALLLSMGYTSYALGFVEDEDVDRARMFYLRGRDYGLRVLNKNSRFAKAVSGDMESFQNALNGLSRDDVPAVFWTTMGWGSYVNLSLTDPEALADLPKVEAMMTFVKKHDPEFYYGGASLFLGTWYGGRSPMLGGNPEMARTLFEECFKISESKFLLAHVFYARSYAVQTQNRTLFMELLNTVDSTSLDVLPEARLPNAIAKKKATILRSKIDELF